jgi:AcrR family transcriptional regulator
VIDMKNWTNVGVTLGRPRGFDIDAALDQASGGKRKGYEGASVSDRGHGINPPSLYAAFGNKEGLFRGARRLRVAAQRSGKRRTPHRIWARWVCSMALPSV